MTPEKWDGKTREMVVWTDVSDPVHYGNACDIKTVIGYNRDRFTWVIKDKRLENWPHCADIPKEESYITPNMTSAEIIEKFKNLRTELMHWLINNDTRNLLLNNLQYGIKTALNLTHANHHFIDVVDFSKIDGNTQANSCKPSRRMTNAELFKWLAQGNGAMRWSNNPHTQITTKFEYREYQANDIVSSGILIRGWHEAEWHEPLIEVEDD